MICLVMISSYNKIHNGRVYIKNNAVNYYHILLVIHIIDSVYVLTYTVCSYGHEQYNKAITKTKHVRLHTRQSIQITSLAVKQL